MLTLKAALKSDPNNTKATYAKLSDGSATLDEVTPNTTYIVTAKANISGNTIMVLSNTFHTPANGKLMLMNLQLNATSDYAIRWHLSEKTANAFLARKYCLGSPLCTNA